MQQGDQFNKSTVDWLNPDIAIDTASASRFNAQQEDIDSFQRDGVVLIKNAFSEWVEPLRTGFQRNLDNPQAYAFPCESNPEGKPGRFFDSYCNWQLIPEYLDYILHSSAASMAGQFMQSSSAQFFHEHAFMKTPGTQHATPWHQDLPYYCVDGKNTASVYVALDHADTDVAVRFVKGSHRWNKLFYPRIFEDGSNFNDDSSNVGMEAVPEIDSNPERYEIAEWSLAPGDAVVFDFRTLHGTSDARIHAMRRAFSTRWLGDDVVYCERPGEISPPYVSHNMTHGDVMREDWFPVLWRR